MIRFRLAVVLAVAAITAPLAAKGPTVKLSVMGASLAHPVNITSGPALAVSIWDGDFLGPAATEPDRSLPRYTVSFFAEPPRGQAAMMYVVQLALDTHTGEGFVYLPGSGDPEYRANIHTILREGQDGKWHRATSEWSRAMARALAK